MDKIFITIGAVIAVLLGWWVWRLNKRAAEAKFWKTTSEAFEAKARNLAKKLVEKELRIRVLEQEAIARGTIADTVAELNKLL